MVIYRTPQLIKTGQSVAVSQKITFSKYPNNNIYRNYSNYAINVLHGKKISAVRLCSSCRSLHSSTETPRNNTLTKLTPQEVFVVYACIKPSESVNDDIDWRVLNIFNTNQKQPVDLKTIESKTLSFKDLSQQIEQINIIEELASLFLRSQVDLIDDLERSLTNSPLGDASDIIAAINSGVRANLLVINGENVEINPAELQKFILQQSQSFIRTLYPTDLIKQLLTFATISLEVNSVFSSAEPIIARQTLPLSLFSELTTSIPVNALGRSIISDLQDTVKDAISSVISTAVSPLVTQVNNTLTNMESWILSFYTETDSSDNILVSLLRSIVNTLVQTVAQLIEDVQGLLSSVTDSLTSLLTSLLRKRREIDFAEENAQLQDLEFQGALSDGTALLRSKRSFSITGILSSVFSILWKIISVPLNLASKSVIGTLISWVLTKLTTFLTDTVTNLVDSLIDQIFPCSSCS